MSIKNNIKQRTKHFCQTMGIDAPILLAPMAGACPPELSIAVANAGGMGACGTLLLEPEAITQWATTFKTATNNAPFQLNLWIPDPSPQRNTDEEKAMRAYLGQWAEEPEAQDGDRTPPNFESQCEAMLAASPMAISSIMGVYPTSFVKQLKAQGIQWFAFVTTVAEAIEAQAAGADVIVAQGAEAGGHRGVFDASMGVQQSVGLFSLLPAVVDAVTVPVVATGGIADVRGACAALMLGASAVQIGTGYLRCPESGIASAWSDAIGQTLPEQTLLTTAFSGRFGRSIATKYTLAMEGSDTPKSAPYPVQRGLTQKMRGVGAAENDLDRMQAWAGQSAKLAPTMPAGEFTQQLWEDICVNLFI